MDYSSIIAGIFLTAIVYLIFPIIYRGTNGKVPVKVAKKLALINSIVCYFVFCLIAIAQSNGSTYVANVVPAFLYNLIAKAILTDKTKQNDSETTTYENNQSNGNKDIQTQNNTEKIVHQTPKQNLTETNALVEKQTQEKSKEAIKNDTQLASKKTTEENGVTKQTQTGNTYKENNVSIIDTQLSSEQNNQNLSNSGVTNQKTNINSADEMIDRLDDYFKKHPSSDYKSNGTTSSTNPYGHNRSETSSGDGYNYQTISPRPGISKRSCNKCVYGKKGHMCGCPQCPRYEKNCMTSYCECYKVKE